MGRARRFSLSPLLFRLYCWTGCSVWGPGLWGRSIRNLWENQSGKKMNVLPGHPQQTPITHLHRVSDSTSHTQVVRKKHGHRLTLLLSIYVQSKSDSDRKTGTERKQLWSDLKFTVLPCYHCLCSARINVINFFLIIWENQSLLWIKWLINNLLFDVYNRSFPLLLRILQMIERNDLIFSLIFSALSFNREFHTYCVESVSWHALQIL